MIAGLTNAQVALLAAVEASKNMSYTFSSPHEVKQDADQYLEWLNKNTPLPSD